MTYDEALSALEKALTFGIDLSLEPIEKICAALGDPQTAYSCIQVAGTNGKTSTTRMIAALLHAHGFNVGLYVSPHLVKYPERIEINGAVINNEDFAEGIEAALSAANSVDVEATEFELLTSAALWLFAKHDVDWVVLECGMGGRWDATSVVAPKVSVITGVALEHTQYLGDTIEKIAAEKAAIIKPGGCAVFAQGLQAQEVFERRALQINVPYQYAETGSSNKYSHELSHLPRYQRSNAETALAAVRVALGKELDDGAIRQAFSSLQIPGRFEVLQQNPLVLIDAAHNPQSARILAEELSLRFNAVTGPSSLSISPIPILLIGVLADKDAIGIIQELCPLFTHIVATASSSPRSISAHELAAMIERETGIAAEIAENIDDALKLLANKSFIATGSITVAGEIKGKW